MESLSNNDDKTNSSKNVRFYELATVFEEERLSTKSSDYESDEGVDTASYSELDWTRAKDSGSNGGIAQARVADVDHVARVVVDEQHHGQLYFIRILPSLSHNFKLYSNIKPRPQNLSSPRNNVK